MTICPFSLCPVKHSQDYSQTCPRADCPRKPRPEQAKPKEVELVDTRPKPVVLKGWTL